MGKLRMNRIVKYSISGAIALQLLGLNTFAYADDVVTNQLVLNKNSAMIQLPDGRVIKAVQPITEKKGRSYIPLASIAPLFGYKVSFDAKAKQVIAVNGDTKIQFSLSSPTVKLNGQSLPSAGAAFTQKGSLMIPLTTWSQLTGSSFTVEDNKIYVNWDTIVVENLPPVADFITDKAVYKQGEHITYVNLSHDEKGSITRSDWEGNEPAFYKAGEYAITLTARNNYGLSSAVTRTIKVTDEVMYTKEEHDLLFTAPGDKFTINGGDVLEYGVAPHYIASQPMTMVRSNSPEHLFGEEGILYEDTISGAVRMNIHNQNRSAKDLKVYLIATNSGITDVELQVNRLGVGGPVEQVTSSGKAAVSRFLDSLDDPTPLHTMQVPAGQSIVVLPEVSNKPIRSGTTLTSHSELYSSDALTYRVVVVDPSTNPIDALSHLMVMPRDGKHVRGTFQDGNRELTVLGELGKKKERIVISDNDYDIYIEGVDKVTGMSEINVGNNGVLYNMTLQLAPNTLVGVNARGGHYGGSFLINGHIVELTPTGLLKDSNEVGVLYRSGDTAESIDLSFVLASGSNMPLNFVFMPVPPVKP